MKDASSWQYSFLGVVVRWLGSIQLAVPVMTLAALGMVWGTYLESTQDAKVAKATVYVSWWFIALMALVCVSLLFAAITRYPWKRKHIGFLMVHASMIALIVGGFWSLFGRIEGHMMLQEGTSSFTIETGEDQLELVEHVNGQFKVMGAVPAPMKPRYVRLGEQIVEIVEVWDNVQESFEVADDGPEPYRAVQIQFGPVAESMAWIGDEAHGEAPTIMGMHVRVLPAGASYTPPTEQTPEEIGSGYQFIVGEKKYPLPEEGQEAFPGWKVVSIKKFSHASVSAGSITDDVGKQENPAVDVMITDDQGTLERHTAFDLFPDMAISKTIEGQGRSGAKFATTKKPPSMSKIDTLVIYGEPPAMKLAYVTSDGKVTLREHAGEFPFVADFGENKITILKQFTRAQEKSKFTKGPKVKDRRPALVVRIGDEVSPIAWNSALPVNLNGRAGLLRFGPKRVDLPFTVRLDDFRKMDYPGTDMAMAYESSVTVSSADRRDESSVISMNSPLKRSGWKVYQSGFQEDRISIFSVMRDPGLPLTYLACTTLCIGIIITFYGKGLSRGHPGIPLPFSDKEQSNAPQSDRVGSSAGGSLNGAGGLEPGMGTQAVGTADPGRRTGDAAGYIRA